jgi:hypothetical protein
MAGPDTLNILMAGLPSPASATRAASLTALSAKEPSAHGPGVFPSCSTVVYFWFLRRNCSILAAVEVRLLVRHGGQSR